MKSPTSAPIGLN